MLPISFTVLLGLIAISVPLAATFILLAIFLDFTFATLPVTRGIGELAWSTSTSTDLMAIPFFVLMGEILVRSGAASQMYRAISPWLSWLPGGLMHSNVGACALFASTSGSSVATASTITTVALPQVKIHGYNERLFLGSLACGGTLGILIPPSINMVVFGVLTDTSIPRLFLGGILPGLVLTALFITTILLCCWVRPEWGGRGQKSSWPQRIAGLPDLLPPFGIFLIVVGPIYTGWATVTEAAGLGVVGALVLAIVRSQLSFAMLRAAIESMMTTLGMIMFIIVAAYFLNFALASSGLIKLINDFISHLSLSPNELLIVVVIFYVVLGCFMEVLSMTVLTVPIVTPVMVSAGYDAVWIGILIVVLSEIATVTPPVGMNLYVVQAVREKGPMTDVMIGVLPFLAAMFVLIVILAAFPQVTLWIPNHLY
jgi:tripartite ATP-independent transporter DctM subunit